MEIGIGIVIGAVGIIVGYVLVDCFIQWYKSRYAKWKKTFLKETHDAINNIHNNLSWQVKRNTETLTELKSLYNDLYKMYRDAHETIDELFVKVKQLEKGTTTNVNHKRNRTSKKAA